MIMNTPLISQMPLDLSSWYSKEQLLRTVLNSVQGTPLRNFKEFSLFQGYQPRMLLSLITYCYATGVLGSQDIEKEIGRNPTVRYLCARTSPDWNTIREFRRCEKDAVIAALVQVFAMVSKLDCPDSRTVPHDSHELELIVAESQKRLNRAIFLDSVAMDD
jgi:transposase